MAASLGLDDLGSGEPALLLLTGWCSSRGRWARAAPLLAADRRVVSFEWRGHGDSAPSSGDFGTAEMVQDALAVIEATGLRTVIPCAASHSGWVAIELRRALRERVLAIVHLDWMLVEPSAAYMELIAQLRSPATWEHARDALFQIWRAGSELPEIADALEVMRHQDAPMWMRSGREIAAAYGEHGSLLRALAELHPPPRVLHLYGQPPAEDYLRAQQRFAAEHDWFDVARLPARTHFSMLETPDAVVSAITGLAASLPR